MCGPGNACELHVLRLVTPHSTGGPTTMTDDITAPQDVNRRILCLLQHTFFMYKFINLFKHKVGVLRMGNLVFLKCAALHQQQSAGVQGPWS